MHKDGHLACVAASDVICNGACITFNGHEYGFFFQMSGHWKGEHAVCPSLSMLPLALLFLGPAERKLMHVYRSQYAQPYPPGGSSETDLQRGCYGSQEESNRVLESHRRLTDWQLDIREKDGGFHHSVHCGYWSIRCLLTELCVNSSLLEDGSWGETINLCNKVNLQQFPFLLLFLCLQIVFVSTWQSERQKRRSQYWFNICSYPIYNSENVTPLLIIYVSNKSSYLLCVHFNSILLFLYI